MPYLVPDRVNEDLYVILPLFNQIRYQSRWKHYERFAKYVKDSGGILYSVEAAFGERTHASRNDKHEGKEVVDIVKGPYDSTHIRVHVRADDELWLKENLINIGISRLPAHAKYIAWPDGDVIFARPNWVGETIHQLQHYKFVQMFSIAQDLSPSYEPIMTHRSFADCYLKGVMPHQAPGGYYGGKPSGPILWHPGFAWAARREALDEVGGLLDFAILGAGDNHMANCLIGEGLKSVHHGMSQPYKDRVEEWEFKCERFIRRNIGVVEGLLIHFWHGKKKDRRYWDRWEILVRNQFDPNTDIKYDTQGVLQLNDRGDARSIALRDDLRKYFRQRNEDSIDL